MRNATLWYANSRSLKPSGFYPSALNLGNKTPFIFLNGEIFLRKYFAQVNFVYIFWSSQEHLACRYKIFPSKIFLGHSNHFKRLFDTSHLPLWSQREDQNQLWYSTCEKGWHYFISHCSTPVYLSLNIPKFSEVLILLQTEANAF